MKIQKKYQGAIPLNRIANEHNESEINTYSTQYINTQLEDIDNNFGEINNKFNEYTTTEESKRNYIMVSKKNGSSFEPIRWSTATVWNRLPLGIINEQFGTAFALDEYDTGIEIKGYAGPILVTAAITYDCRVTGEPTYLFGSIRKNEVNMVKTISHSSGNWHTINLSCVLYVQDGDIIDLAVYKDYTGEISFYNYTGFTDAPCCYMTITEI